MGRFPHPGKTWDEFQWEREIRRDERRISCYFRELAGYMDLPGEESIIFDNLMSRPGLVPAGADPAHWRMWDAIDEAVDDERDDEHPRNANRRRPGDELIENLDKLACEWNTICAFELRETLHEEGLAVCCSFGKLLARVADFVDTEEQEMPGLKISLGKRALSDLNELSGLLLTIGHYQRTVRPALTLLLEFIQQIRERLVDMLGQIRRKTAQ